MSGFPAIRPGLKLKPVGKQGLMSRNQANTVLAVCNGVLNTKLIDTDSDEFHITPNNAVYGIGRGAKADQSLGMHPFKLYATGETKVIAGKLCKGYQVRTGIVEVRPRFHQFFGVGVPGTYASFNQGNYSTPFFPSNCDGAGTPDVNEIITPATFFLDPTPEVLGGVNYGAYYAFYIRITPDTDNGGAYDGTITVQQHRFTIQSGASVYDGYVFPSLPAGFPNESLPIAILQLSTETAYGTGLGLGADSDGDIFQFKRDHYTGRFVAGQDSLFGGTSYQGDWVMSGGMNIGTPGINSANRWWYPGDLIRYENQSSPSGFDGTYVWGFSPGTVGAGNPPGTAGFVQISNFTF